MDFKTGDKVRRVSYSTMPPHQGMKIGDTDTVMEVHGNILELKKFGSGHWEKNFELAEIPTSELEIEVRLCESAVDTLDERMGIWQEEKKSLEDRIQELQQVIKERNRPKGRVKPEDSIPKKGYLIRATGEVSVHYKNNWTHLNISMGNLFYDEESAERAVHDRKQRVLRGEGV